MRKVYLNVTYRTMIPVIATARVIAFVEDGVSMDKLAEVGINGGNHRGITIEDVGTDKLNVENADDTEADLDDQITDFITASESRSQVISHEVEDSK